MACFGFSRQLGRAASHDISVSELAFGKGARAMIAKRASRALMALGLVALTLSGCADLNTEQQRVLTGGAGGAAVGAVLGAIGGNAGLGAAAGAGAGLLGGYLYSQYR